ncbi:cation diffusion facilitator family transporter [Limosilactobacillus caecicola]|uniref:cation diffusion facilitator family transporter n=1 Tax=Limosilactobacillus caecicola TaxID=2941332 RepID=UPI00203B9CDD|nr:cation diffusion facilitator family transporter [Limosilactobacillus caecicola]
MDKQQLNGRRFFLVTVLNVIITVVEIIGGLVSGSLALLSDAFHNFGDSLSIILGYVAQVIAGRPENSRRTFGYRRAEILAAFLNALFLIIMSVFLIIEAVKRFQHPEPINGQIMLIVAVIGLIANLVSAALLHAGSHDSLNIKATYLHVLSDSLSSVAVIIGAIILMFVDVTWLDPLLTIAVAIYIAYEAWPIIRKTIEILMQSAPQLDYPAIEKDILAIDGVEGVHHLHAWSMDEHRIVFSAHINCRDMKISECEPIYRKIEQLLTNKYNISHVTLQAECQRGRQEDLFDTDADEKHFCN